MRTYVFVVPTSFRVNSILRTDVYTHIARQPDTRTVVVSPLADDPEFRNEFKNAIHVPLAPLRMKALRRYMRVRDLFLGIDSPVVYKARLIMRSVLLHRLTTTLSFEDRAAHLIRIVLRPIHTLVEKSFNWIEERTLHPKIYLEVIREYSPEGVILGTVTEPHDIVWLALSRRYALQAFVVDMPWSYLDNRLFAAPRTAHLFLWSTMMKEALLVRTPYKEELLHITGCQRYDYFAGDTHTQTKEEFFAALGLDPQKKLIVYFTTSEHWNPHQHQVVTLMLEEIAKGTLPPDTQILVRLGWKQLISKEFQALVEQYPNLHIQRADNASHRVYPTLLLSYCDVAVSASSSLALDAAVLNAPMVYAGFSGYRTPHPDDDLIKQVYAYEFIRRALDTEGVRVAYDADSFLTLLKMHMTERSRDAAGRSKLAHTFLGTIDGKAGERIARTILKQCSL